MSLAKMVKQVFGHLANYESAYAHGLAAGASMLSEEMGNARDRVAQQLAEDEEEDSAAAEVETEERQTALDAALAREGRLGEQCEALVTQLAMRTEGDRCSWRRWSEEITRGNHDAVLPVAVERDGEDREGDRDE